MYAFVAIGIEGRRPRACGRGREGDGYSTTGSRAELGAAVVGLGKVVLVVPRDGNGKQMKERVAAGIRQGYRYRRAGSANSLISEVNG